MTTTTMAMALRATKLTMMATTTTMVTGDDDKDVDGNSVTGNKVDNDVNGTTGDDNNNNNDGNNNNDDGNNDGT